MKKKILRRCLAGMPVGVMISVVITIIILSFPWPSGTGSTIWYTRTW